MTLLNDFSSWMFDLECLSGYIQAGGVGNSKLLYVECSTTHLESQLLAFSTRSIWETCLVMFAISFGAASGIQFRCFKGKYYSGMSHGCIYFLINDGLAEDQIKASQKATETKATFHSQQNSTALFNISVHRGVNRSLDLFHKNGGPEDT